MATVAAAAAARSSLNSLAPPEVAPLDTSRVVTVASYVHARASTISPSIAIPSVPAAVPFPKSTISATTELDEQDETALAVAFFQAYLQDPGLEPEQRTDGLVPDFSNLPIPIQWAILKEMVANLSVEMRDSFYIALVLDLTRQEGELASGGNGSRRKLREQNSALLQIYVRENSPEKPNNAQLRVLWISFGKMVFKDHGADGMSLHPLEAFIALADLVAYGTAPF